MPFPNKRGHYDAGSNFQQPEAGNSVPFGSAYDDYDDQSSSNNVFPTELVAYLRHVADSTDPPYGMRVTRILEIVFPFFSLAGVRDLWIIIVWHCIMA